MPLRTDPAWPPIDYSAAMPYDYRGCCWPYGPEGEIRCVQMRVTCIGVNDSAPINPAWGRLATGQLLVINSAISNFIHAEWLGADDIGGFPDSLVLDVNTIVEDPWVGGFNYNSFLGGVRSLNAEGTADNHWCGTTQSLPVTFSFGPAPAPERMAFRLLKYWQVSPYPYLGP